MTEIVEQWRPIDGYEGLYEVSNLGKVRSLDRIDSLGRLKPGVILKPKINHKGYLQVGLHKEGKQKWFSVHRLVAHAFIPNTEGLPQINHIDEDKTNNRVDNLEWCDCKYNNNYGTRNERMVQTGISNGNVDPEMCGIKTKDKKEYYRLRYLKKRDQILEYQREYQRERYQRLKKKQEKNNRPSETSLW